MSYLGWGTQKAAVIWMCSSFMGLLERSVTNGVAYNSRSFQSPAVQKVFLGLERWLRD